MLQEHLIHKDLINSKLEKLFKSSEEKRRLTNILFARHMGRLNFFVDNAHKQLTTLKEAQSDMLKNKDIIDYFGDTGDREETSSVNGAAASTNTLLQSVSSLSLTDLVAANNIINKANADTNNSKDNLFVNELDDDQLIDDNLMM